MSTISHDSVSGGAGERGQTQRADQRHEVVGERDRFRVQPGGHHFATSHTLERYESAFYRPIVSDWRNFETWQEDGARTATERANRIWKQLLREYEPPPQDPARAEAIESYVARRRREIGARPDGG